MNQQIFLCAFPCAELKYLQEILSYWQLGPLDEEDQFPHLLSVLILQEEEASLPLYFLLNSSRFKTFNLKKSPNKIAT